VIASTLDLEEGAFLKTMKQGHARFDEIMEEKGVVNGRDAFFLYDTFGFPFEVTQELAAEQGVNISEDEYRESLVEAQEKSRSAVGAADLFGTESEKIILAVAPGAPSQSTFVGYDALRHATRIVQISPRLGDGGTTNGKFQLSLEETPFYAESGGQVGDTGKLESDTFAFRITNTWKEMGLVWHDAELLQFQQDLIGLNECEIGAILQSGVFFAPVLATVDAERRLAIMRNHTATHLLHAALRMTLGPHVTQAGSLVAADRLRFDFTHRQALSDSELAEVEDQVNRQISKSTPTRTHHNVPLEEARKLGAMMLFGEKYGDFVRVVEIPGYSLELCGGTHVGNIAEIGLFKITSEASSAGGVRRIEAVTGYGAFTYIQKREETLLAAATALKSPVTEVPTAINRLQKQLRDTKKIAKEQSKTNVSTNSVVVGALTFESSILTEGSAADAKSLVDRIAEKPSSIGFVALMSNGKVAFFCKLGKEALQAGSHAGEIVKAAALATGGGGGGSAVFAQAGGRDASKLEFAIRAAIEAAAP
jgi:alanyl-tRNA synthetase